MEEREKGRKDRIEEHGEGRERERGEGGEGETSGIYDQGPTYVSAHYGPRGIKGAAFTTSHIQPFTASEI